MNVNNIFLDECRCQKMECLICYHEIEKSVSCKKCFKSWCTNCNDKLIDNTICSFCRQPVNDTTIVDSIIIKYNDLASMRVQEPDNDLRSMIPQELFVDDESDSEITNEIYLDEREYNELYYTDDESEDDDFEYSDF